MNKRNHKKRRIVGFFCVMFCILSAVSTMQAQDTLDRPLTPVFVLKNNLLYDATMTLNLGMEFRLNRKLSMDLPFSYNPWTFSGGKKMKLLLVQPELRYWKDEVFRGFFGGLHFHAAQFNTAHVIDDLYRYEGWFAGAGLSLGYRWNLSGRWALEATIGAGYTYIDYTKYTTEGTTPAGCRTCGHKEASEKKHFFTPTRAGLSLSYTIGKAAKKQAIPEAVAAIPYVSQVPVQPEVAHERHQDTIFIKCGKKQYQNESGAACILFPVNQSVVYPDFGHNREELSKIEQSFKIVREIPKAKIESITIEAYASPEGELEHNIGLSQQRATALGSYLAKTYDLDINCFKIRSKGENWEGLGSAVKKLQDLTEREKSDILQIIDIEDLSTRKILLKKYGGGAIYKRLLQEVYPFLRICEYRIDYSVPI